MKKILTIVLLIAVCILYNSCESALQENPKSRLVKENFYKNGADALSALTSVYGIFSREGEFPTIFYMSLLENRSDYSEGRGSQAGFSTYDSPMDNTSQSRVFAAYNDLYQGINRANAVIDNVGGIENMNTELRDQYIAEARFLRAFFYMNLVKYWGGVPLRLEEFTSLDQIPAPRASVSEVWEQIINDLTEAIPNLADTFPESEAGRVTSWAAKAALADAYLNIEDWTNSRDMAEDIISNGPFSLVEVKVADDFLQIYGPESITHSGEIFSAHQSETNGNGIATHIHRPNTGFSVGGYYAWLPVEGSLVWDWDTNDLRQQFSIYTEYFDENGELQPLPASTPKLFNKYRDAGTTGSFNGRNNIPFYRLAEMYLIYAEASNEIDGPTALALERLNIVRRRGYGYPINSPSDQDYPQSMSASEFKDAVLKERVYELNLEMKRWNDLLRTGRAQQAIEITGKSWSDVSLLLPLPIDEINNNPALGPEDQNPGY
ncbi:RagB/SusD domain-containing protein [Zunongwangia atlantica 22II14-10F7]|uniref:RagB/SusD domain-containing protein n=2 Tax=Zunongwangia TaxID=417127 RepID=A0A1Y1T6X2_9FLAO|nr:RagB/SusD domain-containing protein [Zunongwangia atlantica 22II14-10F7]|tara:strand:- start:32035 stop:33507 length:1473 start_codon:yes stop_codon:yes gene_type:complete